MSRVLAALLVLVACEREHRDAPPPPPMPLVPAVPDAMPKTLSCASGFPIKPSVAPPPRHRGFQDWKHYEARMKSLEALPLDKLLAQAKADELGDVLYDLLMQADPDKLTPLEARAYAVGELFGEVSNGGFDQYFFNSSGDDASDARAGLAEIGPRELVPVFDCALTAFPGGKPNRDRQKRIDELFRWGEERDGLFEPLDLSFFAFKDRDDRLRDYLVAHVHELTTIVPAQRL
jgi:hypothetical protein